MGLTSDIRFKLITNSGPISIDGLTLHVTTSTQNFSVPYSGPSTSNISEVLADNNWPGVIVLGPNSLDFYSPDPVGPLNSVVTLNPGWSFS